MKFDDVWIQGTGRALGELRPVPAKVSDHCGMRSVSWSEQAGPELAVAAGRQALAAAGDVLPGLHVNGAVGFSGIDLWSASCWVADQLLGEALAGLSLQISALCNTSVAGLEMAASMLGGRPDLGRVLITVGDRFPESAVDRFEVDPEIALGDGGAAAVLGRGSGLFRLLACASRTEPAVEGLQRGDEPFRDASPAALGPLVLRKRTRQFFAAGGRTPASVVTTHVAGVRAVVLEAMAQAGTSVEEARWVIPPFVGANAFRHGYQVPLGLDQDRTLYELGLRTGHLGGGDHLFALDHLLREGLVATGDKVALVGVGGGMSFSCAVLEAA
ncbi:3-oxoacyl-[acyl-carrier-protein] synthase III C-terminal domain-containing protein [Amycolatopsis sp. NPDC059657]|uniref:3-oxoacyl-[acyl-carrier-protein] synthase III C-terminal domain-containing protein n=1 Tax=Amycolatopsis sp. NPDC059657 TaxID=3346899 RepID=UPI00367337DE